MAVRDQVPESRPRTWCPARSSGSTEPVWDFGLLVVTVSWAHHQNIGRFWVFFSLETWNYSLYLFDMIMMSSKAWETSVLPLLKAAKCQFVSFWGSRELSTLTFASPCFKFDHCLLHRVGRWYIPLLVWHVASPCHINKRSPLNGRVFNAESRFISVPCLPSLRAWWHPPFCVSEGCSSASISIIEIRWAKGGKEQASLKSWNLIIHLKEWRTESHCSSWTILIPLGSLLCTV